jgi:hypothetical protein
MKKVLILAVAAAIVMLMPSLASAQTANGVLTVTATVQGSIGLVFNSDGAGVPLNVNGTNAATLAFGNVSAFGALSAGVTRVVNANSFTVSSAVDVNVTKTNSASANYKLTAQLGAPDAVNTWQVGGVSVTSASPATITATGTYAANSNFPVAITVLFTTPSGTAISNTINYQATAN